MATVNNIRLSIDQAEKRGRWKVTLAYNVCFSRCEALAGSVFVEKALLRGDDTFFDDNLYWLANRCVKAERAGCVERKITRTLSASVLDEDADIHLPWGDIIALRDEIYARVSVQPFKPSGASASSNIVTGQFGLG